MTAVILAAWAQNAEDSAELLRAALQNAKTAKVLADIRIEERGREVESVKAESWSTGEGRRGGRYFKGRNSGQDSLEVYLAMGGAGYRIHETDPWKKIKGMPVATLQKEAPKMADTMQALTHILTVGLAESNRKLGSPGARADRVGATTRITIPSWDGGIGRFEVLFPNNEMIERRKKMHLNVSGTSTIIEIDESRKQVLKVSSVCAAVADDVNDSLTIRFSAEFVDYGRNFAESIPAELKGD
jgi:hypothetical protein